MLRLIRRASIINIAVAVFVLMTVPVIWSMWNRIYDDYIKEKAAAAESIIDAQESMRTWANRYDGGIYVRSGSHIKKAVGKSLEDIYISLDGSSSGQVISFHQKSACMAIPEIAKILADMPRGAVGAMKSDNYVNELNRAKREDQIALSALRDESSRKSFVVQNGDTLYVAKPIRAADSCLRCHGYSESAPQSMRDKYPTLGEGRGAGYRTGDVVAVSTVTMPVDSFWTVIRGSLSESWFMLITALTPGIGMLVFVWYAISRPLQRVTSFAQKIVSTEDVAKVDGIELDEEEQTSNNEIHKLNDAVKRCRESLGLLLNSESRR